MIGPKEEDLLQRELDDALSAQESAALDQLLAGNPAAVARREELRRLAGLLAGLVEDPPADLAANVMRRLPAERQRPARLLGFLESARYAFARPATRRPALAFAAGLLLGGAAALLLLSDRLPVRPDGGGLSATVLPGVRLAPSEGVDQARFDEPGLRGEIAVRRVEGRLLAEIRIDSAVAADVVVEFAEEDFTAAGFERNGASPAQVALEPGRLHLTNAGKGLYRLVLEVRTGAPSDIRVALSAGDRRVERSLRSRPAAVQTGDPATEPRQLSRVSDVSTFRNQAMTVGARALGA